MDENDGRVTFTDETISVADRNIRIHPLQDPSLAYQNENARFAPILEMDILLVPNPRKRPSTIITQEQQRRYQISLPIIHNTQQRRFQ